jgi:peptidoglycan/xylan/chitin deacetylase (PgdA/CDA1 family)
VQAILTFHSVDDSGSVLSIAPNELRSLVEAIRASDHEIVGLRDILDAPSAPRRIALTFDDGTASLHENALPVLRDLSAPATVFLTTGWLGRDNRWPTMPADAPRMSMLDWDQVGDLHGAGWKIEAHTVNHPDLRDLPDDEIDRELEECDLAIEKAVGERPTVFAYPYGHHDARVETRASSRYRFAVTAGMGMLPSRLADAMCVPRLETFYFRSPSVHKWFGSTAFRGYLAARTLLRRLRHAE